MLIHGLINSILPCRGLSKLIINGEPLPKSNNSPRKKRPQIATPPSPPPRISVVLRGDCMDIFWNYTINARGVYLRDPTGGVY